MEMSWNSHGKPLLKKSGHPVYKTHHRLFLVKNRWHPWYVLATGADHTQ